MELRNASTKPPAKPNRPAFPRALPWAELNRAIPRAVPWAKLNRLIPRALPWAKLNRHIPRALPWAKLNRAFSAKNKKQGGASYNLYGALSIAPNCISAPTARFNLAQGNALGVAGINLSEFQNTLEMARINLSELRNTLGMAGLDRLEHRNSFEMACNDRSQYRNPFEMARHNRSEHRPSETAFIDRSEHRNPSPKPPAKPNCPAFPRALPWAKLNRAFSAKNKKQRNANRQNQPTFFISLR
jgi:hypothetical protein